MQRLSQMLPNARLQARTYRSFASAANTTKTFGPALDENSEPRFLEQVKLFYNDAA